MTSPHRFLIALFPALCLLPACANGKSDISDPPAADAGLDTGQTTTDATITCGNGVKETGESCDGTDLGGDTCASSGATAGDLACTADCKFDKSACEGCGNGKVDGAEECDGADLAGKATCEEVNVGDATEKLSCTEACVYDLSNCSSCGDGLIRQPPEDCDPGSDPNAAPSLGGMTCEKLGFSAGSLDCSQGCRFNTTGCSKCGDGKATGPEACDGSDLQGKACSSVQSSGGVPFTGGTLACGAACDLDVTGCFLCGDGVISGIETCEPTDFGVETCATQGFTTGTLACAANCQSFDTSACTLCGDSKIEGTEQCEGANLAGKACLDFGFDGPGNLACSSACMFDTSDCSYDNCGDLILNGKDECDCGNSGTGCSPAMLANKTCKDFTSPANTPYTGGSLRCSSPTHCVFDLSACTYCGDGTRDTNEECDLTNFGGDTCASLGFASGPLTCTASCKRDTSACIPLPIATYCHDLNLAVPDNNPTGATDTIAVPVPGKVVSVKVQVKVQHAWAGDVSVRLAHSGVTTTLIDRPGAPSTMSGCDGANLDCTLDDDATTLAENTCSSTPPALGGVLKPQQPLSGQAGQSMTGDWTLQITDTVYQTVGTLQRWCVVIAWE